MTRLRRRSRDGAAPGNALVRRQLGVVFDMVDQQVESVLRMGFDQLELRERDLVGLDVIAVLHLVKPVGRCVVEVVIASPGSHFAVLGTSMMVDVQQRKEHAGVRAQRAMNSAAGGESLQLGTHIGN